MKKVVIIGSANLLNLKIENLLLNNGFQKVEIYKNPSSLNIKRHTWEDAECFIIDLDHSETDLVLMIKDLRQHYAAKTIPIISLSGNSDLNSLKRAIAAGCNEFLVKPFDMSLLLARIYKICVINKKTFADDHQNDQNNSDYTEMQNAEQTTDSLKDKEAFTLRWVKDFEVGIPLIDEEHKELILHFNQMYLLMKDGRGHEYFEELLLFLKNYVAIHFEHEEELQIKAQYPDYEKHKEMHLQFSSKVYELEQEYSGKQITDRDLIHISIYIRDWLYRHILIEDNKVGKHILKSN